MTVDFRGVLYAKTENKAGVSVSSPMKIRQLSFPVACTKALCVA